MERKMAPANRDLQDGEVEIRYEDRPKIGDRVRWGVHLKAGESTREDIQDSAAGALFGVTEPDGYLVAELPGMVKITCPTYGSMADEDGATDDRLSDWMDLIAAYLDAWDLRNPRSRRPRP